ncbi:hypothetical protein CJ030_MR8G023499 [Morella rubra]|uniref:Uncharacterized protein n=1 Tax=Morella rubra TaxID=262757 RepID=A0A6A1URV7_9ROSI|nr:hypothetical protein CJ030_MR8G023499 [Morella rubra]
MKMVPNIALLRQPESTISHLVTNFPSLVFIKHDRFAEVVRGVMKMRFDPSKVVFVQAVRVLSKMSGARLGSRFELYKRRGWSKDVAL